MKFPYFIVTAILCNLGCYHGDEIKLPACTLYPGNLHIFWTSAHQVTNNSLSYKYAIIGSSETPSTDSSMIRHFGDVAFVEWSKISVYECLTALDASYRVLQQSVTENWTKIRKNSRFTFFLPPQQDGTQLVNNIREAVGLWTDNDWVRACKEDPGYVYILWEATRTYNAQSSGWVYKIKGASGPPPTYEINRMPTTKPMIHEEAKFPVRDCKNAIVAVFRDLQYKSGPGIKQRQEYGNYAFSVGLTHKQEFLNHIKYAIFPLYYDIPKKDWVPCAENDRGFLYLMRVDLIEDEPGPNRGGQFVYYCHRIFGASQLITQGYLQLSSPFFTYMEVTNYPVDDCAKALRKANTEVNRTAADNPWKTVRLVDDWCYKISRNGGAFKLFVDVIQKAIG